MTQATKDSGQTFLYFCCIPVFFAGVKNYEKKTAIEVGSIRPITTPVPRRSGTERGKFFFSTSRGENPGGTIGIQCLAG